MSGYANNPLCLDDTEFSVFNILRKYEAFWIPLLHQDWHPAQVSQHAWGCVIRSQAAFPCLTRVIKALLCDSPVHRLCRSPAGPRLRAAPAHTRGLMDGPVLMSSEGNRTEPSLLEAQASKGGS